MARTKLTYSVQRESQWDFEKIKNINRIVTRGFDFTISGTKSAEEFWNIMDSFSDYFHQEDIKHDIFQNGEDIHDTVLMITIDDVDQKEDIIDCYRDWKKSRR